MYIYIYHHHHHHYHQNLPPPPLPKKHHHTVQVALKLVAMDSCIMYSTSASGDPELVGGGGGWSCMLLMHPVLTSTDAGPDLCTLHPDLCTLWLWWLPPAAIYSGG